MGGRIEIGRPKPRGLRRDAFRRFKILVDGREVARLREGGSVTIEVEEGPHDVGAAVHWVETEALRVNVPDAGVIRVTVGPGTGPPLSAFSLFFLSSKEYLRIEEVGVT